MSTKKRKKNNNDLADFYYHNKVLIWLLIIVLLLVIILKIVNRNNQSVPVDENIVLTIEPRDNLTVGIGNSISLKANINVADALIVWNSSDTTIAKVDNGTVTGVNYGKVKIIADYYGNDGRKYEDSCYVSVIEGDASVSLTDVSFPNGELYMPIGKEYRLNLILTPANALVSEKTFVSSDENIVSVSSDGVIRSHRSGHARVIVLVNGKYRVTKDVYVNSNYQNAELVINPTSLSFDTDTRKVKIGTKEKLNYAITPNNADRSKLSWTSSEPSIVSVNEYGEITAKSEGETTVSVLALNGQRADIIIEVYQDIIPVTDIIITTTEIKLEAGKNINISPVVEPSNASNKGLSYLSLNPDIVSVSSSGLGNTATLSALKKGQATIIISSGRVEKRITVKVTGNGNNSEIDEDGNKLPTTIKVTSDKNNLAKTYNEVVKIPVPGTTNVSVSLSVGVGKIKYCYSKYEDSLCTPKEEKYSDGTITIPSGDIYVLRIIKYDYNDNVISSDSVNYINGVLYYYINTKSSSKLYTINGAYDTSTLAIGYPSKIGDRVTIRVNNSSRYLNICSVTNTTCIPNTRVNGSYTITIDKVGLTRIYVNEYDINNNKIGNTELYYVYVKEESDTNNNSGNKETVIDNESQLKVSDLGIYNHTSVGKYLQATVKGDIDFNLVRFCYITVTKGTNKSCNLDLVSNSVSSHNGGSYFHPIIENKTYYGTFTSTKNKDLLFDLDGLDTLYNNSDTNKDVILEFAVKSTSRGYTDPIRVRINMTKKVGTSSYWSSTFIR